MDHHAPKKEVLECISGFLSKKNGEKRQDSVALPHTRKVVQPK